MYAVPVVTCMTRQKAIQMAVLIPAPLLKIFPKTGSALSAAHPKTNLKKKSNALSRPYPKLQAGPGIS